MKHENIIRAGTGNLFKPSEIILLQGEGNYTRLFLLDGTSVIVGINLRKLEGRFLQHNFFRTHKSYMINMNYVHSTQNFSSNTVMMKNQMTAHVSRRKKRDFLQSLS